MRGVSLDEIAQATKIGTRLLRALEEEQFDLLPGGIFNKGFVRAYAKYLGINEEQAVADYLQAAGDTQPDVQLIAHQSQYSDRGYGESTSGSSGFPIVPVLILLLCVGAGFAGWRLYQQHLLEQERTTSLNSIDSESQQPEQRTGASSTASTPEGAAGASRGQTATTQSATTSTRPSEGAVTSGASAIRGTETNQGNVASGSSASVGAGTGSEAGKTFEVVVSSNDRAWVSIRADGKILVRGIIDPGQIKTVRAKDEVVLWTGNAGATEASFDGKPVKIEGGVNDVKVLVFKPSGLASITAPPPARKPEAATPSPTEPSPTPQ